MKLEDIKEQVKDNRQATFEYYSDGALWYKLENGFVFPVPISDTGTGMFLNKDKAILFMRWIRKHILALEHGRKS